MRPSHSSAAMAIGFSSRTSNPASMISPAAWACRSGGKQDVDGVELALGEHRAQRSVDAGDTVPRRERPGPAFVPVADGGQAGAPDRPQGRGVPVGDVAGSQEPDGEPSFSGSHHRCSG